MKDEGGSNERLDLLGKGIDFWMIEFENTNNVVGPLLSVLSGLWAGRPISLATLSTRRGKCDRDREKGKVEKGVERRNSGHTGDYDCDSHDH